MSISQDQNIFLLDGFSITAVRKMGQFSTYEENESLTRQKAYRKTGIFYRIKVFNYNKTKLIHVVFI